jgi:hypothetical protein
MTHITIKDLPLDVELDRAAMAAIAGGSRTSSGEPRAARHSAVCSDSSSRIVDYPPGFAQHGAGEGPAPNGQRSLLT